MYDSYYAVIFAGINSNSPTFEHPGAEIANQLRLSHPGAKVKVLTLYPYDDSVSGDTISDTIQVMKNAYELCGNTAKPMAYEIENNFSDEQCVFFVGYSGGGIAATVVAELMCRKKLMPVSKIIRVGSPTMSVGKNLYGKIVDLQLPGDPVCQVEIPRFFKNLRPYQCYVKDLQVPGHTHSCYFKADLKDTDGISNLTKTVQTILKFVKN
ncbi:MAG: hypothetical protein IKW02_03910 [Clostridia bacterium]|nr:hypothetical protein [Clostridia bacterium]